MRQRHASAHQRSGRQRLRSAHRRRLCRWQSRLPHGAVHVIERDAIFAERRATGAGVSHARRDAHAGICAALQAGAAAGALCVVDTCNARAEGRALYMRQHHRTSEHLRLHPQQTPRCVLLSFDPLLAGSGGGGSPPEGSPATLAAGVYRATLLERVRARAAAEGHPTFPSDDELQQKALDGTLAAMEWPGQAEACASGARLLRVDPCVPPEQQLAPVLEALFEAFWWTDSVDRWILG